MRILLASLLLALTLAATPSSAQEPEVLHVGIMPEHAALKSAELWLPLLAYLEQQLGVALVFHTITDQGNFMQALAAGDYDLAWMSPLHYAEVRQNGQYVAIAAAAEPQTGLLVGKRGHATTLSDLRGRQLCFPGPANYAATELPRQALKAGHIAHEAHYVGTHDSVYRQVAQGGCVAGGGSARTLALMDEEVRHTLVVLWRSLPHAPPVLAMATRQNKRRRTRVQELLLNAHRHEATRGLLAQAGLTTLVRPKEGLYARLTRPAHQTAEHP
jgi:phosphonate transport system substrate-binding protein